MNRLGSPRAAVALLTRIPAGRPVFAPTFGSAWFPLVGLGVAALGVLVRLAAAPWLGAPAATVLAIAATVVVTGAFHEDGLADTADGVFGGHTPARRLEIMRDSRLGTYGTVALVGDLGLRTALLVPLSATGFVRAFVLGETLGRIAPLVVARIAPPARSDGQGATLAAPSVGAWAVAATTATLIGFVALDWWFVAVAAAAVAAAWAVGGVACRRLGGRTGDVLGASVGICRLVTLAVVVALVRAGA